LNSTAKQAIQANAIRRWDMGGAFRFSKRSMALFSLNGRDK